MTVTKERINIWKDGRDVAVATFGTPDDVAEFIANFDAGRKVKPFEFVL